MSTEWRRVEELFHAASQLQPSERRQYLAASCADDPQLLKEVESLLACEGEAAGFFENAIGAVATSITVESAENRRIGPYRILRTLGQGGMGAVFLATRDDDQYRKQVALKLVRQGMDSPWLLERFRYERQILAGLEHPHIARMLDGGATDEGLPYLVMEFVEGQPISTYCESHDLDLPARLRLFREVCGAVEYAHRKLVIHRDLKPANILVAADGTPRLLDFGTAKLVNPEFDEANRTQTGAQMLTPDYASPEQLRGEPVTTGSDVYSLGVILYELLTGRKPFDTGGRASLALERAITGTEIQPPSLTAGKEPKLKRVLAGDLDNIVLMAVRKEPERRYGSVEQLSDDVRRYLEGLTIRARPDTLSYRVHKFVQRNRLAVAAVAVAVVGLFAGITVALWQAHEARLAAERAERRFSEVRELSNTFLFDVQDRLRDVPGTLSIRKTLVDTALVHLDNLAREAEGDPGLQFELASAYDRVGRIMGNPAEANLGNTAQALENFKKAVALFESALLAQPGNDNWLIGASAGYRRFSEAVNPTSAQQALTATGRAIDLGSSALKIRETPEALDNLRAAFSRQSEYRRAQGDNTASLQSAEAALQLSTRLAAKDPGVAAQRAVALSLSAVGVAKRHLGDLSDAANAYRQAKEIREVLVSTGKANSLDRRNLGLVYLELAKLEFQLHADDFRYAAKEAERSLSTLQSLARDAGDNRARSDEASAHMVLGSALRTLNVSKARNHFLEALAIRKNLGESALQLTNLASTYKELGSLELAKKNWYGAGDYLDLAAVASEKSLKREPDRTSSLGTAVATQLLLVELHSKTKNWQAAESWSSKAIETALRLNRTDDPFERTWLADAFTAAGRIRQAQGDLAAAAALYRRSLAVWQKPPASPQEHRRRDEAVSLIASTQNTR